MGFTEEGKLVTALRFTPGELADIFMANELYMASPDGKAQVEAMLEKHTTPATITIKGNWEKA